MSGAWYQKGRQNFLEGDIDIDANTITAYLIDTADYTFSQSHETLADVAAAARVASVNLTTKTTTNGVFDASDSTFSSVTGDSCEAIVIAKNTGTDSTSLLFLYIDSYTGFPVSPDGSDISVQWPSSGIAALKRRGPDLRLAS